MWPKVFPSSALWVGIGVIALADAVAMTAGGFHLTGHGTTAAILAAAAGAAGLGYLYSTKRPDERLAALGFGAAYLICYTLVASFLSYLGASLGLPLLDARFAHADAALGLDWLAALQRCADWPALGHLLRFAYFTSMAQIVAVFLVLSATRQLTRLAGFLWLFTVTSLATILLSSVLPAAGAFIYFDPPASLRDVVGHDAGIWHLKHFEGLRSGLLRTIDPGVTEGLVTFPSFHAGLAVITAWAFQRTRYLAMPALLLNIVVIASAVPVGGHYFVDIFAGIAIGLGAIGIVVRWRPGIADWDTWWTRMRPAGATEQPELARARVHAPV